jgi:shikimate dehydrogenase
MSVDATRASAQTGLVCVLGHPVRHSLSPSIHNAAFRHRNLDLVYLAFDVTPDRLSDAVNGLRAIGARGANLTLPHKEAVIELLDDIDLLAARVGAVNTVVNEADRLTGYNTDVAGFSAALRTVVPEGAHGLRCIVLGAGGAARAVVAALVQEGAAHVSLCNRTHGRALALCSAASGWGATVCEAVRVEGVDKVVSEADLIVNATSVGLASPVKDLPIGVDTLHSGQVVVDLVYGSGATALVKAAKARGAAAIDGLEMLVMQAASSYQLWTGQPAPVDVMRESAIRCER